ncbi:multiple sugar transport system ATP-binding protein [Rhizobium sp. PP-F2F-G38]|uniref:ABC transporter ATP-binding protein n=1 Tax=Ferranicluibacter rubi TaxID=2715133 RepID=A0AA44CAB3_9HYPH|nr:ABC transporter ATP-binding protein [Ferranicluibacter rubi]PYE32599.1 carbohydrate ABC transporter ATP-binding protein (CUT1 family) [Rhizobium sp. PP-WC-1G-195]PYE96028.1 multiple sugar transport system ATP-binding protein [Rhizobium sp. PP-F2F-G38]TCP88367.1 multiple sugar transport system ATP-binding protein [Rhizobium sp. PP-CC-2G-626]TCQ22968.1 multiple sugar transport system ATP-binding protein [Rhizobium sp. PP-CC-3G-465]NHT75723.1 ABC transporter ATP-binding protein [Ferranicluibac
MPSLQIDTVVKSYDSFTAIKGVSFTAEPGEFIVMVGPSGCGKSTLLRSIAGLETITSGAIRIDGRDITHAEPSDRGVAMVFQNYALYPHMTVAENMGFALKMAGRPKTEIAAAVAKAAKILRIEEHLHKTPKQLSGGQKQRVAIGRAITRAPDVFLFDEPLSNLDAALRSQMRVELGRLHAELKATMVYVTHDQTEAMTMATRIVVMNAGLIEQVGSPLDLYNRPRNRFVAGFLGSPRMNFIKGRIVAAGGRTVTIMAEGLTMPIQLQIEPDADVPAVGDVVTLGLRAETFGTGAPGQIAVPARVAVVESLGRETLIYADAGNLRTFDSESQDGYLAAHRSSQVMLRPGDPLTLSIDPAAFYLFDRNGETLRFPPVSS